MDGFWVEDGVRELFVPSEKISQVEELLSKELPSFPALRLGNVDGISRIKRELYTIAKQKPERIKLNLTSNDNYNQMLLQHAKGFYPAKNYIADINGYWSDHEARIYMPRLRGFGIVVQPTSTLTDGICTLYRRNGISLYAFAPSVAKAKELANKVDGVVFLEPTFSSVWDEYY